MAAVKGNTFTLSSKYLVNKARSLSPKIFGSLCSLIILRVVIKCSG